MVVPLYMGIAATPQPDEDEPVPGDMLGTMMIFRSGAMVYAMGAMVHAVMSIVFALIHVAVYNALGLAGSRYNLAMDVSLRIVPELPWKGGDLRDFLEATLQGSFRAAGLDTSERVDVFVENSLRNEVDYVRDSLPEFPADWYKHDWAVARLRERRAEVQARTAGETTS